MTTMSGAALAVEESGWGHEFRFVQPRNLSFWVFVWGVTAGTLNLLRMFGPSTSSYMEGATSAVTVFVLYTVPWLLIIRWFNRYTRLPAGVLAAAGVWGGLAATGWLAINVNGALLSFWPKVLGVEDSQRWHAGFTAPYTEEISKALAVVLLIGIAGRLVRSAYDGLLIGAMSGLGFQIVEDVIYSLNGASSGLGMGQVDRAIDLAVVRIGVGLTSHVVYSAIFCAGLMWLLGRDGNRRVLLGAFLVLYAMFAHFVWDAPAGLAGDDAQLQMLFMFGIVVLDLVVLFFAVRTAARPERAWIRRILAPEVEGGAITAAELAAVSGTRHDRRRFLHRADGGRRVARHVLAAADDLAHSIAKDRAQGTNEAAFARSELARVRAAS